MQQATNKLLKRKDWRELKIAFEQFQNLYVDILCKNMHLCGDNMRFRFGAVIDVLNELRYITQEFVDELIFAEMMQECFGDIEEPKGEKRNERSVAKNRLRD